MEDTMNEVLRKWQEKDRENLLKPIEDLNLPNRIKNALKGALIYKIHQLVWRTRDEVLWAPGNKVGVMGVGEKTLPKIESALATLGLELGMDLDGFEVEDLHEHAQWIQRDNQWNPNLYKEVGDIFPSQVAKRIRAILKNGEPTYIYEVVRGQADFQQWIKLNNSAVGRGSGGFSLITMKMRELQLDYAPANRTLPPDFPGSRPLST